MEIYSIVPNGKGGLMKGPSYPRQTTLKEFQSIPYVPNMLKMEDMVMTSFIVPQCMQNTISGECVRVKFNNMHRGKDVEETQDDDLEDDEEILDEKRAEEILAEIRRGGRASEDIEDEIRGIRAYLQDRPSTLPTSGVPTSDNKRHKLCPSTPGEVQLRYCKGIAVEEESLTLLIPSTVKMTVVTNFKLKTIFTELLDSQDQGKVEQEIAQSLSEIEVPAEAHSEAIQELLGILSAVTPDQVAHLDIYDLTLDYPEREHPAPPYLSPAEYVFRFGLDN